MNGDDFTEGGCTWRTTRSWPGWWRAGWIVFNISCGSHERQELFVRTHPSAFLDHGRNVYLAAAIKQVVSKPVSCVGALGDPEQCEEYPIASGQADIVELGRALLADPFPPEKGLHGPEGGHHPLPALLCLSGGE